MTNKELQQNALAISEIIAQSGVSSEEFQKTGTAQIQLAMNDTKTKKILDNKRRD